MLYINQETTGFKVARHQDANVTSMVMRSQLTEKTITLVAGEDFDVTVGNSFYTIQLHQPINTAVGQYTYNLMDENAVIESGYVQFGQIDTRTQVSYETNNETKEYNA